MNKKNTKILLLSPPKGINLGKIVSPKFQTHPIGLIYLAAMLEKYEYTVKVIDAFSFGISLSEITDQLKQFKPKVVGITAMTISALDAYSIAETIKAHNPHALTVMGGAHSSARPEEVLNTGNIDIAVIGEGEYILKEICDAVERNDYDFSTIGGIVYKKDNGEIIHTKRRPKIQNLDKLPFPAYHLLPSMKKYNPPPHWGKKGAFASIITSRGCPYGCQFCCVTRVWGKKYRVRSVSNIIKEIEFLFKNYNVRYFTFRDSTLTLNKKRVIEICKAIIDKKLSIQWNCNARVNEVSPHVLKWMKKAGCKTIMYGIESGDEKILAEFKKITKNNIIEAVNMTHETGIASHGYFMFGFPEETKKSIDKTIKFAKKLKLDEAGFTTVTPFPGTNLWDYLREKKLITTMDWNKYDLKGQLVFKHPTLSAEEMLFAQKKAFRTFYLRPSTIYYFLRKIRTINDLLNFIQQGIINFLSKREQTENHQ